MRYTCTEWCINLYGNINIFVTLFSRKKEQQLKTWNPTEIDIFTLF